MVGGNPTGPYACRNIALTALLALFVQCSRTESSMCLRRTLWSPQLHYAPHTPCWVSCENTVPARVCVCCTVVMMTSDPNDRSRTRWQTGCLGRRDTAPTVGRMTVPCRASTSRQGLAQWWTDLGDYTTHNTSLSSQTAFTDNRWGQVPSKPNS